MEESLVKEDRAPEQRVEILMHSLICFKCGITFSIPNILVKLWEEEQQLFMCPNGHSVRIINHSRNNNIQEQLKSANLKIAELTAEIEKLRLELEIWKPASIEESE